MNDWPFLPAVAPNMLQSPVEQSERTRVLRIVFIAFLILLFIAPLPYGLVPMVPQAAILTAIWVLVTCMAVIRWRTGADSGLRLVRWEAAAFAILVAWICVQMLPIGGSLAHPLWSELPGWLGRDEGGSISLSPVLTFEALMRLLAYGALFWLVLQFGQDRKRAQAILIVIVASGWLNALYGIINYIMGNEYLLLAQRYTYAADVTGTLVNRNSAAAFFGLCLAPITAYIASVAVDSAGRGTGRSRTERIGAVQRTLERGGLGLAVLAVPAAAILMTHSRAGTLSVVAAVMFIVAISALKMRRTTWYVLGMVGVLVTMLLAGALLGSERLLERFDTSELDFAQRLVIYDNLGKAIQDSPIVGFGYGTFERSFFLYVPADIRLVFDRAHSDWLEGVFGLGWIGGLLLNGILIRLGLRCVIGIFIRRRDWIFCTAAGAVSLQLAIHSTVDFSLQMPAVAICFVTLLAIGIAQSRSPRRASAASLADDRAQGARAEHPPPGPLCTSTGPEGSAASI